MLLLQVLKPVRGNSPELRPVTSCIRCLLLLSAFDLAGWRLTHREFLLAQHWMRHLILFISNVLLRTDCSIVVMWWYWSEGLLILAGCMVITVSLASTLILTMGRENAHSGQLGQLLRLQAWLQSLLGNALLGISYLLEDLFAVDTRLGCSELVWVKLVFDCNWNSMLLPGQVDREYAVDLSIE